MSCSVRRIEVAPAVDPTNTSAVRSVARRLEVQAALRCHSVDRNVRLVGSGPSMSFDVVYQRVVQSILPFQVLDDGAHLGVVGAVRVEAQLAVAVNSEDIRISCRYLL